MAEISLREVTKTFPDGTTAVASLDLLIPDGALTVLVGPSGCGKTTLLRMVAGLEQPTMGTISIGDQVVNDVPPKRRDVAMVFQNYALYPHMSVYDNMAFALRRRREGKDLIERRVQEAAAMLGLVEHLRKKPAALSGGQRQRVAMGRAIVRKPMAFLMDEPLSNLDAKLRVEMRTEILRIQRELGVTTIFVTHDQTEALTMGDLVAVMRGGVIQQLAPPGEVFGRPANLFVAGFVGSPPMNLFKAALERANGQLLAVAGETRVALPQDVVTARPALAAHAGREVVMGIRPEDFQEARERPDAAPGERLRTTVELAEAMGRESYLHFTIDAEPAVTAQARELLADTDAIALEQREREAVTRRCRLTARVSSRSGVKAGDRVELVIQPDLIEFFDLESGDAI
jgi:multiple sugar transport system ATP-binding protein